MWKTRTVHKFNIMFLSIIMLILSGCSKNGETDLESQQLLEGAKAFDSAMIMDDELKDNNVKFDLAQVERGDFATQRLERVNVHYPIAESMQYLETNMDATFGEFLCALGDQVKEGDQLLSIQYDVNLIELEKLKLQLVRTEESYDKGRLQKELKLQDERDKLNLLTNSSDMTIQSFRIEELEAEFGNYIETMEQSITELKISVDEYELKKKLTYITAPFDGIVSNIQTIYPGDTISFGMNFLTVVSFDEVYLRVENDAGSFRYNMEVDITASEPVVSRTNTQNNKQTNNTVETKHYKGRVISGDNLVSDGLKLDYALIELLDGEIEDLYGMSVRAVCYPQYVKDVLLVDKDAVSSNKSTTFVMVYSDGYFHKRNFISGGIDASNFFIFDGLTEGMTVLTD